MKRRYQSGLLAVAQLFVLLPLHAEGEPSIGDVFRSELACALIEPALADMPVNPVFQMRAGQCRSVVPDESQNAEYFLDVACSEPLAFQTTALVEHCGVLLDSSGLGELSSDNANWTLPPGTRFDLGALSLDGITQPWLQQRLYRTISTARGNCQLEMRVYKSHPNATGQRSLLALHGGSWSARGFGFFGLEMTVPHFVEQGFVVYVPFYRLLDDKEGSEACNQASVTEVIEDANAALDWVQTQAAVYGSEGLPVLFGQSAGAHLAASLVLDRADEVAAGVLFYPPTDFTDFVQRVRNGRYDNPAGLAILDNVIGGSAATADLNASPIPENSFPIRVVEQGLTLPPLMMLQGMADGLVEARQSQRLCDALAGRALLDADQDMSIIDMLREVIDCSGSSSLHLIREGRHALDVCIGSTVVPTDLCFSGSEASRKEVASSIREAVMFAKVQSDLDHGDPGTLVDGAGAESVPVIESRNSGGGGLSTCWLVLLVMTTVLRQLLAGNSPRVVQ
ncbi:MAG: alpha/beta hydrolase [Granulosicoccus sp.]